MRAVVALALSGLLLAGCLTPAEESATSASIPTPSLPEVPLLSYDAAGAPVPLPPEFLNGTTRVVHRLLGTRGAEPNVGITSSGAIFVSAGDFVMRSKDNGLTWEKVFEFGKVAEGVDYGRNSDPMLWVDRDTDRVFAPFMFPVLACSSAVYSDDDGETWIDRPMSCGLPVVDHQKIATGAYGPDLPALPNPVYKNLVYYCYNKLVTTNCAMSYDGGLTYPVDRVVTQECGGINGQPHAAPDGTVYVPLGLNCGKPAVAVSTDNGLTWTLRYIEDGGLGNAEIDPDVTVTPDGTAYYFWRAAKDNRMYVARSTDGFATAEGPFLVSPPEVTSARFSVVTSGDDGRLAFAYYGTNMTTATAGEAPDNTRWHLFVTFSLDAASANPTFVTQRVTPDEDPIQIGYMWEGGGGDPGRNHLDFIDLHVGPEGRAVVAFTDGCVDDDEFDCANNPAATLDDSRARATAVAILEEGPSLYAAKGRLTMASAQPAAEEGPESGNRSIPLPRFGP
ncbi:MAG TPA: sialidase family protein [Candidatus Thermoplasmatota archaeon]|nr:sialidase family protein [Candidatus Thermoplasmatota archaeon]